MTGANSRALEVSELLLSAERPLILAGPEALPARNEVLWLAKRLGAVLLTTPDAKSFADADSTTGVFSLGSSARARSAMHQADLVLALSTLGEFSCRHGEAFRHVRVIQITDSIAHTLRGPRLELTLIAPCVLDALIGLRTALAPHLSVPRPCWFGPPTKLRALSAAPAPKPGVIHPAAAMNAIQRALPDRVRLCVDASSAALYVYEQLQLSDGQQVFSSMETSACMTEALLASLGIRLASGAPTLALVGDWGFCMAPNELHTAAELGLDRCVMVVWDNHGGAFIGTGVSHQGISVPDELWRNAPETPSFFTSASQPGPAVSTIQDSSSPFTRRRASASAAAAGRPGVAREETPPRRP